MVGGHGVAVSEVPPGALAALAGADGSTVIIGRDGTGVVEIDIEAAILHRHLIIHLRQGIACAGKSREGKVAVSLVDKRAAAVIGDVVVGRHLDTLGDTEGSVAKIGIPIVGKSRGRRETVRRHLATIFAQQGLLHTSQREVSVAVVAALAAVACSEADINGLSTILTHVDTDGGPVLPQHVVWSGIPP